MSTYYLALVMTDNTGTFRHTTELADLDGDGDLDVILQNVRKESEFTAFAVTTLWLNQGDGRFIARRSPQGPPGDAGGWASAAGDVDQDGDIDLFIFQGHYVRLALNLGGAQEGRAGEFKISQLVNAPKTNEDQFGLIHLGDLNGDGQLDGIVTGCCGRLFALEPDDNSPNFSWIWFNQWHDSGRLETPTSKLPALEGLAISGAALGDLDSDGDLDIFAAVIAPDQGRNRDPSDRVFLNNGTGAFTDSGQRLGDAASSAVALGDLDRDGDLDALVGAGEGAVVWINQGRSQGGSEGMFAPSGQPRFGSESNAVFLLDLDIDGDLDALVAAPGRAEIWWNDGQGAFTRSAQRFRYSKRHAVAVADFNGDRLPDVFAANYDREARVWLNQGDGTFGAAQSGQQ